MNLKFTNPILPIGEIKIPDEFSPPRLEKLKKCMDFYRENDRFDRQIIVDGDKALHDGYCAYLVAYLLGVKTVGVLMVMEQAEPVKAIPPAKPEPVKLCCVKDYEDSIKRGDTGVFDPEVRGVVFGETRLGFIYGSDTFEQWKERNKYRAPHFWPLVRRPAKVGETIFPIKDSKFPDRYKKGQLLTVTKDDEQVCDVWKHRAVECNHSYCIIEHDEYLVLSGYHGDSE